MDLADFLELQGLLLKLVYTTTTNAIRCVNMELHGCNCSTAMVVEKINGCRDARGNKSNGRQMISCNEWLQDLYLCTDQTLAHYQLFLRIKMESHML